MHHLDCYKVCIICARVTGGAYMKILPMKAVNKQNVEKTDHFIKIEPALSSNGFHYVETRSRMNSSQNYN